MKIKVAFNVEDGSYAWHHQYAPHDCWDYDSPTPPLVYTAEVDGESVASGTVSVASTPTEETTTESPGFGGLTALAGVGAGAAAAARRLAGETETPDEEE